MESPLRALTVAAVALSALTGGGCAEIEKAPEKTAAPLFFPAPPEPPRLVYEAALRSSADVHRETDRERMQRILTGAAVTVVGFEKPLDVAARGGRVYVTDTLQKRVHVFDAPRKRYFAFGYRFEGALSKPTGISVDGEGRVYVADVERRAVVVYDELGLYLRLIGGSESLRQPVAVAVAADGARIYVVDSGGVDNDAHRIVVFDGAGRRLSEIGGRGAEPGRFNLPVDAAVASDGTLYVLDAGNFRVQVFDADGRFQRAFGGLGRGPGQLARPRHLAVDREANVYVSDAAFGNVQMFSSAGELSLVIGQMGLEDKPARFGLLAGVAVDETGRVFAVDQYFRKVEIFRPVATP